MGKIYIMNRKNSCIQIEINLIFPIFCFGLISSIIQQIMFEESFRFFPLRFQKASNERPECVDEFPNINSK